MKGYTYTTCVQLVNSMYIHLTPVDTSLCFNTSVFKVVPA